MLPGRTPRGDRPRATAPGTRSRSRGSADSEESEPCTRFSRLDSERSPRMVPGAALRPSVAPLIARTTSIARVALEDERDERPGGHEVAQRGVEVLLDVLGVVGVGDRRARWCGAPSPRCVRPLASKRPRISPTRPRRTASGLSRTRVSSPVVMAATLLEPRAHPDPRPGVWTCSGTGPGAAGSGTTGEATIRSGR